MGSLKTFIKAVRAAKTLSDERNVIQKESAKIRTSFRDERTTHSKRRQNVAKLLYLFTLGERTHFGQVECLKLLASPHFTDKRLGYLGTMLLLDENQEVLMLVTNSLDIDLGHTNQYVVSLALTTLANIASATMATDLFQRVEKLMTASNPYIKKKAALCALRIIRRAQEYEDIFVEHAKMLLTDSKNHGVLMCGASLVIEMLDKDPNLVDHFAPLLPEIISTLKMLSSTGYNAEFDVGRVPDPFLQTRLLRLLRAMGQDNADLSEQMYDILAAIATNTDSTKNVGNAVLYEVVLTIFGIDTGPPDVESGLRVLGVNILAKFLSNGDNNTRYSALSYLLQIVSIEPAALQRHRQTIVDCFVDPDISIRRRALALAYELINAQNVRVMVRELLDVLDGGDAEFKSDLVFHIALNAERYAPSKKWHIDTLIRTFVLGGNYTKENVLSAFIILVIDAPELQQYATQKLFTALKKDVSQRSLTLAGLWLIGEYADLLLKGGSFTSEDDGSTVEVSAKAIVDVIMGVLASPYATQVVQEYAINALVKLSTRIKDPAELEAVRRGIENRELALNVEVQQRAVEYTVLMGEPGPLRKGLLARMPAPELGEDLETQHARDLSKQLVLRRMRRPITTIHNHKSGAAKASEGAGSLLDLDGDDASVPAASSELLNDIFGGSTKAAGAGTTTTKSSDILNLFDSKPSSTASPSTDLVGALTATSLDDSFGSEEHAAWSDETLALSFSAVQEAPGKAKLRATLTASAPIADLAMLVAVPKSQQLALQGLSRTSLTAGTTATQAITVTGTPGGSVRLRLRISYTQAGTKKEVQTDFAGLPKGLL